VDERTRDHHVKNKTDMNTDYPQTTWRLLNTQYLDGATNMAIDEAISRAVQANLVPPTLTS
jgi:hypothetical protein